MRDGNVIFETGETVPASSLPAPFERFFRTVREESLTFQSLVEWDPQSFSALQAMQFLAGNTPGSFESVPEEQADLCRVQSPGAAGPWDDRPGTEHHCQRPQGPLQQCSAEQVGQDSCSG